MVLPENELMVGNCVEVLQGFPADSIDLTITSPPYDGLRYYEGYSFEPEAIGQALLTVTRPGE